MQRDDIHLSDETLMLAADGELSPRDAARVESHLAACWTCRTRKQEIEGAVTEFVRFYRRTLDAQTPSSEGPRALLTAKLAELSRRQSGSWFSRVHGVPLNFSWAVAGCVAVLAIALSVASTLWLGGEPVRASTLMIPDRSLTPGATVLMSREEVCRATSTRNKPVSSALQREVFREYGIRSAKPYAYEVDYLITPALGGADDIHNLWPESYEATVWNAHVKDQLEDYLRDRVCAGTLDLATAQQDLAVNWIEAYKRYFHSDQPLDEAHRNRP
jgi:Putative zinc-finger